MKKVRSFYDLPAYWQSLLHFFFTFEPENIELAYQLMEGQRLTKADLNDILKECGYFSMLQKYGNFFTPFVSSFTYIDCSEGVPDYWPPSLFERKIWNFVDIGQFLDLSNLKISNSVERLAFDIKDEPCAHFILPSIIPENVLRFEVFSRQYNFPIFCENLDETKAKYPNIRFDKRFIQKQK